MPPHDNELSVRGSRISRTRLRGIGSAPGFLCDLRASAVTDRLSRAGFHGSEVPDYERDHPPPDSGQARTPVRNACEESFDDAHDGRAESTASRRFTVGDFRVRSWAFDVRRSEFYVVHWALAYCPLPTAYWAGWRGRRLEQVFPGGGERVGDVLQREGSAVLPHAHGDNVEADLPQWWIRFAHVVHRCFGYLTLLLLVHGLLRKPVRVPPARLHLHENKGATGTGDHVDLAPTGPIVPSQNQVTLKSEEVDGEVLAYRTKISRIPHWLLGPDGELLASGCLDGVVRVWDGQDGQELYALRDPSGQVGSVAWSSDGARLAWSGPDGRIQVWDFAAEPESLSSKRVYLINKFFVHFHEDRIHDTHGSFTRHPEPVNELDLYLRLF